MSCSPCRTRGRASRARRRRRCSERFYTGSNARPGQSNGIGLALSRELAELHHGSLTLESEPGKGARFTLTLPIDLPAAAPPQPDKEEAPGQPESPAGQGAPRTETDATAPDDGTDRPLVLLVDDNTQLLSMMAKVLSPAYRTATATGGEEALALLQREDVDVVVSDVMMPGMDGFALCRRVKSQIETSHIPVIMLTAKQSPDDRVACYEAGADGFLAKPFELKVLAARIDNLIRARHQRQEDFKTEDRVQLADLDYASADTQFLQAMADSIHAHLAEEGFGVEQLATDLNVSKSTLHRKVKAMTGLTPLEFIRNVKLKYACAMLARHDRPIAEVAYATGFSSPKYFTRCFKEEFGLTPRNTNSNIRPGNKAEGRRTAPCATPGRPYFRLPCRGNRANGVRSLELYFAESTRVLAAKYADGLRTAVPQSSLSRRAWRDRLPNRDFGSKRQDSSFLPLLTRFYPVTEQKSSYLCLADKTVVHNRTGHETHY